jgi:hypothetical protein
MHSAMLWELLALQLLFEAVAAGSGRDAEAGAQIARVAAKTGGEVEVESDGGGATAGATSKVAAGVTLEAGAGEVAEAAECATSGGMITSGTTAGRTTAGKTTAGRMSVGKPTVGGVVAVEVTMAWGSA